MFNKNNFNMYHYTKDDIDKLYHHNVHTFWATVILSSLFTTMIWFNSRDPSHLLLVWYVVLNVLCAIRLQTNKKPVSTLIKEEEAQYTGWVNKYLILTTAMTALWGLAGFHFLPVNNLYLSATIIIMLLALLMTMSPLVLVSKFAIHAQAILLSVPVLTRFYINSDGSASAISIVIATLVNVITIIISAYFLVQILQSLRESTLKLQNKIDQDELTGLANKRSFERTFRNEWRRAMRSEKPLAILMVNIDDFKLYNDAAGHQKGNLILKNVADEIQNVARRPADLTARYLDDLFVVLLPGTDCDGAFIVADRLRLYIQNLHMVYPEHPEKVITVSVGLSSCLPIRPEDISPENGQDVIFPAMLINTAEYALKKAKDNGKNCCVTERCDDNMSLKKILDEAAKRDRENNTPQPPDH